jgi:hypothetical protein
MRSSSGRASKTWATSLAGRRRRAAQEVVQLDQMLAVNQPLDQIVAQHVLLLQQGFDAPLAGEQKLHLGEVQLEQALRLRGLVDGFGHGAVFYVCRARVLDDAVLIR